MKGDPVASVSVSRPSNRVLASPARPAKRSDSTCWLAARIVTPKAKARLTSTWVWLAVCREITISGGSSEMEANELTVMPCCWPSCAAVTIVTPEVQARMAARSPSVRSAGVVVCISIIVSS